MHFLVDILTSHTLSFPATRPKLYNEKAVRRASRVYYNIRKIGRTLATEFCGGTGVLWMIVVLLILLMMVRKGWGRTAIHCLKWERV